MSASIYQSLLLIIKFEDCFTSDIERIIHKEIQRGLPLFS